MVPVSAGITNYLSTREGGRLGRLGRSHKLVKTRSAKGSGYRAKKCKLPVSRNRGYRFRAPAAVPETLEETKTNIADFVGSVSRVVPVWKTHVLKQEGTWPDGRYMSSEGACRSRLSRRPLMWSVN